MADHGDKPEDDSPPLHFQETFNLAAKGLATVLGELEARIMDVVWGLSGPESARDVHERVVGDHPVAHLTVVTVLNKLVRKGFLRRAKVEGVYHYEPALAKGAFQEMMSRRVVEAILSFEPKAVAASFVDLAAERDPELLAELRRLVDAKRELERDEEDR